MNAREFRAYEHLQARNRNGNIVQLQQFISSYSNLWLSGYNPPNTLNIPIPRVIVSQTEGFCTPPSGT